MEKELVVSSSSHETKIAVQEDNQVVEVYFERKKEYTLAGSIYKGRVTRVLPGMQSAFVNIGLERDAFLYVSDFFEDTEEYDQIVSSVEEKISKMEEGSLGVAGSGEVAGAPVKEEKVEAPAPSEVSAAEPVGPERVSAPGKEPHPFSHRSRRRRPRRKGFPESKYSRHPDSGPPPRAEAPPTPIILPGESLAKYRGMETPADSPPVEEPQSGTAESLLAESPSGSLADAASFPESGQPQAGTAVGSEPDAKPEANPTAATWEPPLPPPAGAPSPAGEDFEEPPVAEAKVAEVKEAESVTPSRPEAPPIREERLEVPPAIVAAEEPSTSDEQSEQTIAEPSFVSPIQPVMEELPERETLEAKAAEQPVLPEGYAEAPPATETEPAVSLPEEVRAGNDTEAVSIEAAVQEAPADESPRPTQAVVREGHRNPRFQRKSRWAARRAAPTEAPPRTSRPRERVAPAPQIADLLKEGQEIIVQIAKEPLGKKGARITSHIALPGRYLVYMPTVSHVGVSHKIASDEERQRLKRIILEHSQNSPGGFIVRTSGEGRSEEELRQDVLFLTHLWADIRAKAEKAKAPALLHHDLDLILRILRDQLSEEFTAVWVDNETEYERLVNWVGRFQPSLVGRVKLYTKDVPLFEQMGIQEEINKALKPKVWLKSGGYIVINQTEALVAIDVNTGKFVGRSSRLEDTIFKTNVDAIQEIVRQIRLRDLGGIIVVDFIDMDERKNRQKVMATLEEALRADRSPSKMLAFNEFGLVAITRKRVRQSLERTLGQPCSYCSGSGLVKSPITVCCEIYTEARKMASELRGKQITLRVNPEVGRALKARDNTILPEIEEMVAKPVLVRNDPSMHIESFAFE